MDALDHFSIPVSGLHDGLHEYEFTIGADFFNCFEESMVKEGDVDVKIYFDKQHDLFVLDFEIEGTVKVNCDRCLEDFYLEIEDEQQLLVKFDEKEWEDADVVYILKGSPKFNVARYIYEYVNLAVPIAKTHDDAGESCDPEMLKYLTEAPEDEADNEAPPSSPFKDVFKGFNLEN